MATVTLSAQPRAGSGKGVARKLRQQDRVPAILYGFYQADSCILNGRHRFCVQLLDTLKDNLFSLGWVGGKIAGESRLKLLDAIQLVTHQFDFIAAGGVRQGLHSGNLSIKRGEHLYTPGIQLSRLNCKCITHSKKDLKRQSQ